MPSTRNLFLVASIRFNRWAPKVSKGRPKSPLVASAEAKPSSKEGPFPCLPQKSCSSRTPFCCKGTRRFPKGDRKALWSPPQRRNPLARKALSLAFHKKAVPSASLLLQGDPKVSKGRSESPLVASAEAKPSAKQRKARELFFLAFHKESASCGRFRPPAGGRGTFPHGKVPKGCRGRPKGACLMAAPGPPVAKQQCAASLAGARPAGFTSVPGRATVAFGAADPSPGSMAPVYPWSVGKGPLRQHPCAAVRAPASVPCKVRTRPGARLVAGPRPNQMACPIRTLSVKKQEDVPLPVQGGSGGIPRPFEGGIGGPGGHREEVGIPPAPLAGGATLQKKNHLAKPGNQFPLAGEGPPKNL